MRAVVVAAAGQVDHSLCPHMNKGRFTGSLPTVELQLCWSWACSPRVVGDFDSLKPGGSFSAGGVRQ